MAQDGQEDFIPSIQEIPSPPAMPRENFIPQREEPPAPPTTTLNYYTPEEAFTRFSQYLPIEATPNDLLVPSDDPRVYTYQMANGNIYQVPAYQEVLAERRTIGEAFRHAVDQIPSRTEVEEGLLNLPSALYGSIENMVQGRGTYGDVIGTATGLAGINLPRTIPDDSLGMFTGQRARMTQDQEDSLIDARNSQQDMPEDVWRSTGWATRAQGFPNDFMEISDTFASVDVKTLNKIREVVRDPNRRARVKLGDFLDHDELYEMYPDLRNVELRFYGGDDIGGSFMRNRAITVNIPDKDLAKLSPQVRAVLLHEVQHYIQDFEGWKGMGMNPTWLSPEPRWTEAELQSNMTFKEPDGFWRGIAPPQDRDGGFRSDIDADIYGLVYHSRDLGKWTWERAALDLYQENPDEFYRFLINNNTRQDRSPVEQVIISDYENRSRPAPEMQTSGGTGWEFAEPSNIPTIAAYSSDVNYFLNRANERLSTLNEDLQLSDSELGVFKTLGSYSTLDDFSSYLSEAGEVQAENTVLRRNYFPVDRLYNPPWRTEYSRQPSWTTFEAQPHREFAIQIVDRLRKQLQ